MELKDYLKLKYPVELMEDDDGTYLVRIPDLPGCADEGKTPEEAITNIEKTKRWWLKSAMKNECPIPFPSEDIEHSGKLLLRIPKYLHANLSRTAKREGVSLNQFIGQLISAGLRTMQTDRFEEKVKSALAEIKKLPPSIYVWQYTQTKETGGRKIPVSSFTPKKEDAYTHGS